MNVFTLKRDGDKHIGKRYANGVWCWDCKIRSVISDRYFCKKHQLELQPDMNSFRLVCPKCPIQISNLEITANRYKVPDTIEHKQKVSCPKCLQFKWQDEVGFNPAFRELGFDKSAPHKHRGLDGASGWSWCTDPETGLAATVRGIKRKLNKLKRVKTEYGEIWTIKQFYQMFDDIIEQSESPYNYS